MDGLNELLHYINSEGVEELSTSAPYPLYYKLSPEEWVNDKYYTGDIEIWDYWKKKFIDFHKSKKNELIITGSTRSGKNFFTNLLIMYQLYELSYDIFKYGSAVHRFPALNSTSVLNIIILSVTIKQAEKTCFSELRNLIDNSPYFMNDFKRKRNDSELIFDSGKIRVSVATTDVRSLTGTNAMMVVLDEANIVGSPSSNIGLATNIYAESSNRRIQTFKNKDNELFGFNVLISSADHTSSFIETRIKESKENKTSYIIHTKKFEIQPDIFEKNRFYMFVGDMNFDYFVINIENRNKYKELLQYLNVEDIDYYLDYKDEASVKIPYEHKDLFENAPTDFYLTAIVDPSRVLRDICGRSLGGSGNFFNNIIQYKSCISSDLFHPFYKDEIEISTEFTEIKDNMLIKSLKDEFVSHKSNVYGISLDLSKRYDSTGMAIGYYDVSKNKYVICLQIQILPPSNKAHKIRYHSIIEFINYLRNERSFNFKFLWCDGYQSEYFIQYYTERGIESNLMGIDSKDTQYIAYRNAILESSIVMYDYDINRNELFSLVHDRVNKKVDHTEHGSKDVSDAVCRLYNGLVKYYGIQINNNTNSALLSLVKKHKELKDGGESRNDILRLENQLLDKHIDNKGYYKLKVI